MTLRMATRYFPEDPAFQLRFAAALLRRNSSSAGPAIERAISNGASKNLTSFLKCFENIQMGSYVTARRYLENPKNRTGLSRSLRRTSLFALRMLRLRSLFRLFLIFIAALSLNGILIGLKFMWLFFLASVVGFPLFHLLWRRKYQAMLQGDRGGVCFVAYNRLPANTIFTGLSLSTSYFLCNKFRLYILL